MSGHTIEIADHLWAVLETMSRDMATEPRALVNQAVFNWARRNGYAATATAPAPPQTPAPTPVPAPEPVMVKAPPSPVLRLVEEPTAEAAPAPLPIPRQAPSVAARIAAIDADVDRYCLAPLVVDAEFEPEAEPAASASDDEEEQAPAAAPVPAVDTAALRAATATRITAIDRAVDDSLPRPNAAPARVTEVLASPQGKSGRARMNTSELNALLGEVDDMLGARTRDTMMSPAMRFVLELRVRGSDQVCLVAGEPVVIGRGAHCDLVVQSPEVSREHAVISRDGAGYVIEDRGSSNGTWVGDEQVKRREIHSGDIIRIGSTDVVASFRPDEAKAS